MRGALYFRLLLLACWLAWVVPVTAQPSMDRGSTSNAFFSVVLPEGFKPMLVKTNEGNWEHYYARKHGEEKTSAVFFVSVHEKKEGNLDPAFQTTKLNAYLLGYFGSMQGTFDTFSKKEVTAATLGGLPFWQVEWEGEKMGRKMSGRLYVGLVNGRRYTIRLQDLEPHAEKGVPLMIETIKNLKFPKE